MAIEVELNIDDFCIRVLKYHPMSMYEVLCGLRLRCERVCFPGLRRAPKDPTRVHPLFFLQGRTTDCTVFSFEPYDVRCHRKYAKSWGRAPRYALHGMFVHALPLESSC